MKRLNIALLFAAGLVCVTAAKADIIVASSSSTVTYTAGPAEYTGAATNTLGTFSGLSAATYNLGPVVTPWMTAIAGSSWVSFDPGTAPGGAHDSETSTNPNVPNGTYVYTSGIAGLTAGDTYVATFSVMADDTADVWLDGVHVINAGSGEAEHCVTVGTGPTCTEVYGPVSFAFVADGSDSMTFDVEQLYGSAEGLDFSVDVDPTPEPSSLMLLGTGLLGAAGAIRRRIRA